jgi:hypothetical protein
VPLTVAAGLQRVDPIDLISGGGQRTHQQTAVGLDADDHRRRVLSVRGDQLVKPADSWTPSATRPVARTCPVESTRHTSWWCSAQSMPTKITVAFVLLLDVHHPSLSRPTAR